METRLYFRYSKVTLYVLPSKAHYSFIFTPLLDNSKTLNHICRVEMIRTNNISVKRCGCTTVIYISCTIESYSFPNISVQNRYRRLKIVCGIKMIIPLIEQTVNWLQLAIGWSCCNCTDLVFKRVAKNGYGIHCFFQADCVEMLPIFRIH